MLVYEAPSTVSQTLMISVSYYDQKVREGKKNNSHGREIEMYIRNTWITSKCQAESSFGNRKC